MSEMNAFNQREKIIKMKLQTAKILWAEDRKEATFLILESIDDPRADNLRDKMGFDEDFEVGHTGRSSMPIKIIGIGAVVLVVLSFLLGTFLNLDGNNNNSQVDQIITENEFIETIIAPTPEPDKPLTQPPIELTGTASQVQLTQAAIAKEQESTMNLLDATQTAKYEQGTATEDARATQATGG